MRLSCILSRVYEFHVDLFVKLVCLAKLLPALVDAFGKLYPPVVWLLSIITYLKGI